MPALAFVAAGAAAAGVALTAVPSQAATAPHRPALAPASHHADAVQAPRGAATKHLGKAALSQVRARQRQLAARQAPSFAKAGVKTFTVNTTTDSDLANPTGTGCHDASTGDCSLRAAVDAANNLKAPVKIVLGKRTYTLTLATALTVTNPAGTSIVGKGANKTSIKGDGSGVFYIASAASAPGGVLFLSDAKVTGGSTTYGGGFYLYDSSAAELVLDNAVVSGNTATSDGGGLYASSYNSIYATDTRFTNNVAPDGAGLYDYWGDVSFRNVTISGNHTTAGADGYGAGIYSYYGVLQMKGGSISDNTAGDSAHEGAAGAIYSEYGTVSLTGVHVDHNTADDQGYAGAIYTDYSSVQVNGGTISHNQAVGADSSGGAIYVEYGSQLDLTDVTMAGNKVGAGPTSGDGGGAIYLYGEDYGNQTNIDHAKITGSNASAIYGYAEYGQVDLSITHSTLSDNHNNAHNGMSGYGCGGAICTYNYYAGVNLVMSHDKVTNNSGVGDYGAGAVGIFGYEYGGSSVNLAHNLFQKNTSGPGGYGGAVGIFNDGEYAPISVRSQSNKFVANTAGTSGGYGVGGALSLYYYATITDKGSTFSKNVAAGDGAYGGAVDNYAYQSARFTGTKFTGNRAGNKNGGEGYGGAMFGYNEAGATLSKVTMSGNRAASYGGGYYSDDYGLSIQQSTISGNTAGTSNSAGYGGGIYDGDSPMTIDNSTIANNQALSISGTPGYGGGIYQDESPTDVRYSTVSGNVAKKGGGIYAGEEGGNLVSSIVVGNKSSKHGSENDCTSTSAAAKLHSLGGNVLGQGGCVVARQGSDKVTKHAGLKKLAHNGGPTETMALKKTSPAMGRGTLQIPSTDQRGHKRPSKHADAGAYQHQKG
ncbi:MAG TPA: choice-of-anchor Q domain-containing protein [Nocardioides sp.]|uniref:choice-of-anchor Q domain-containing protein n=1 Tax=Nocardioides sp. TaxID=35761 RepID=UPI002E2FC1CF|nr:choice-of-anchor Q domain-containing protein [Nocardioides sp.]HEX3932126.1 choice-of-anchor Q domain-containing protein [Nocardioides sp.]